MHILLITAYFPPDTGSAAHLFYELGTALVRRGHQVTVLTSLPGYHADGPLHRYQGRFRLQERMEGIDVIRVYTPRLVRNSMVGRGLWQFATAAMFFVAGIRQKPDVAIVYSPPLPLGLAAWGLHRLRGYPFLLNVQDLFPQSAIDLGALRSGLLIRFLERLERFIYYRGTHITVHSPGNRTHILSKGVPAERVTVLRNWVDTDFISPGPRMNSFRREYGLTNDFIVSFAGVLGYSQDLDVVIDAARILRSHRDICFLIVGDGVEKARLVEKTQEFRITNVHFLPMQPRERYPAVLEASDVCLVTLRREVKTPVVPSKILSAMAAGRPIVAAVDLEGDAPKLIEEAGCGLAVAPGDAAGLARAVLRLYQDPGLRGRMGRSGRGYAETHLSLETTALRYEELMRRVTTTNVSLVRAPE